MSLGIGVNLAGQGDGVGHRLALDHVVPVRQGLHGPQLEGGDNFLHGYQFAF